MNRIAAIAFFVVATVMTAGSASAQSSVVEVNVPFNFTVNDTLLPAGSYTFGFDSMYPDLLIVRDGTKEVKAKDFGQRGSIGPGRSDALIFHHYGSQYFLSEVRFDSVSNGMFLPATKSEQRARKVNRQEVVSIAVARLGGCSTKERHSHLNSAVATGPNEKLVLWQMPTVARYGTSSSEEEVFGGFDPVRSGVMCGWYSTSVACSIFRAS
jgi:hypothetical protein